MSLVQLTTLRQTAKLSVFIDSYNDCLGKYAYADHTTWDELISPVVIAYRASCHDSTKFWPFFIVYGRDPVLPRYSA